MKGHNVDKILEKVSSYNIFNFLFPGVVYCVVCDKYFSIPLIQESIVTGLFLYYFIGLVISRFGSVILEPILKKIGLIKYSDYSDFVNASMKNTKIEVLSEVNNMYRTIVSMMLVLVITVIYSECLILWPEFLVIGKYTALVIIFILFLLSYKKQTEYISKRILANKDS